MQPAGASPALDPAFAQIVDCVRRGECILFLGAGAHVPPPEGSPWSYPEEQRPPLGGALSEKLAAACQFAAAFPKGDPRNLQRVSQYFEMTLGRQKLVEVIREEVDKRAEKVADKVAIRLKQPSPALRALSSLPFTHVVTTNYDPLFERALAALAEAKDPTISIYSPEEHRVTPDATTDPNEQTPLLFKIHGSTSDPGSIVITEEDYIRFVLRMGDLDQFHPVPETIRFRLKKWPTLFVGYSLLDYNLRLLFMTMRWKLDKARFPRSYAVDLYPDAIIKHVYGEYVQFIVEDLWAFVPRLYRAVRGEEMPR